MIDDEAVVCGPIMSGEIPDDVTMTACCLAYDSEDDGIDPVV